MCAAPRRNILFGIAHSTGRDKDSVALAQAFSGPGVRTCAGMAARRAGLDLDGVFIAGPEDRISEQRWVLPTRLVLDCRGESSGTLWVAPCDWAHHVDFLRAIKATLLWECLDRFCKDRAKVTQRRDDLLATGHWKFIQYSFSAPPRQQMSRSKAFDMVQQELREGGAVVAYCINAHHRSVGSVVAFMVDRMGFTVARAAEVMNTHPWQRLQDFHRLQEIHKLEKQRVATWQPKERCASPPPPADPSPAGHAAETTPAGAPQGPPEDLPRLSGSQRREWMRGYRTQIVGGHALTAAQMLQIELRAQREAALARETTAAWREAAAERTWQPWRQAAAESGWWQEASWQ